MALRDILEPIREAIGEIVIVIGLINVLGNLQFVLDLGNAYSANLITIEEYLIRLIVQMIVLPAIPGIIVGLGIHEIRKVFHR